MKKIIAILTMFLVASPAFAGKVVQGTGDAANGSVDQTLIAAQGATKSIRLLRGFCSVNVAATGGGGEMALEDGAGGTRILTVDADALGAYSFDFGNQGYALTANTALNLTVDGAVTTQATADCTVNAWVN